MFAATFDSTPARFLERLRLEQACLQLTRNRSLRDHNGKNVSPYELYTVADSTAPLQSAGGNRPGLTITPDYDFAHAPRPDIVVVPA